MKTRTSNWLVVLAASAMLAGCVGSEQTIATRYVKKAVISAQQGGTIEITSSESTELGGTRLVIPPGSLAQDATISVALDSQAIARAPNSAAGPVAVFGPAGLVFTGGASLTLPVALNGAAPQDLYIEVLEDDGTPSSIRGSALTLDATGSRVTFTIAGFTRFQGAVAGCNFNGDCAQGLSCINGLCRQACAGAICGTDEVCCNNQCASVLTDTTNCGACGVACTSGQSCVNGQCTGCMPETDADFCARHSAACGTLQAVDNCSAGRVAECGTCGPSEACVSHACVIEEPPESDIEFCTRLQAQCGTVSGIDNVGLQRTANCGTCGTGLVCSQNHQCISNTNLSDAQFCQSLNVECGPAEGPYMGAIRRVAECGPCASPLVCNSATHQCVTCSQTDAEFCYWMQARCGSLTANDRCGSARTVQDCGTCAAGQVCTYNQCR